MFRSFVALFVALAALQVASAIDVSSTKSIQLDFTAKDGVPQTEVKSVLMPQEQPFMGFIGDLTVGQRYADETVFRRVVEFNNPTGVVQSTVLNLSVDRGVMHYISVRNGPGSYAVVCNNPNTLGSSRGSVNLRVLPMSRSSLTLIIAAY